MRATRRLTIMMLAVLGAATLSAIDATGATRAMAGITYPTTSFASSSTTAKGTIATLAMGNLADPSNTYWQVLTSTPSSMRFTVVTAAVAVATNGGILVAPGSTPATIALRPTNKLRFSPVLRASGSASQYWLPRQPLPGAARSISSSAGASIAVVGSGESAKVITENSASSLWRVRSTLSSMEQVAAFRSCSPTALTSATFDASGNLVVGVDCAHSGATPFFRLEGGTWKPISLSFGSARGSASVLYMAAPGKTLAAIVDICSGETLRFFAVNVTGSVTHRASLATINGSIVLTGMGVTPEGGAWITFQDKKHRTLGFIDSSVVRHAIAIPPISSDEATLVERQNGTLEAITLDAGGNGVAVLSLGSSMRGVWKTVQKIRVPIAYGSSA